MHLAILYSFLSHAYITFLRPFHVLLNFIVIGFVGGGVYIAFQHLLVFFFLRFILSRFGDKFWNAEWASKH